MTLIKSISGVRETIGGKTADNLTPIDTVKFASAYKVFIKDRNKGKSNTEAKYQQVAGDLAGRYKNEIKA